MKILYGVNAFGNGHITRSRVMAKELKKAGHEVTFLFSGREKEYFFDMQDFGEDVIYKKGLQFVIENGKVDTFKTVKNDNLLQLFKDIFSLNVASYDLIITDFEPITAWAAKLKQKMSIGIGHQYAFTKKIPLSHTNPFILWAMNRYAPVDIELGLHWDSFGQNILPPIIDIEHFPDNFVFIDNQILVYLPFEDQEKILYVFSQFPNYQFIVYNKSYECVTNNVSFKKFSKDGFLQDLLHSSGVICNAGFELASEAIHLDKKILVKPVFGQMEQHSNEKAIVKLNYAYSTDIITKSAIAEWLTFKKSKNLPKWPNVAREIVTWIVNPNIPFDVEKVWGKDEKTL